MADTPQVKSFWQRPEGKTGLVVLLASLAGLVGGTYVFLLPYILWLLSSTLTAAALGLALFALLWVGANPQTWATLSAGYQVVMYKITDMIIVLDPIANMRGYVADLKERTVILGTRLADVRGAMRALKTKIDSNAEAAKAAGRSAAAAQQAHVEEQFFLQSRQQARLTRSNRSLQDIYQTLTRVHERLTKVKKYSEVKAQDWEAEIATQADERKYSHMGQSAIAAAVSVMQGDPNKRAQFERALEIQAADYGQTVGQIEEFMDVAGTFLDSFDAENGVYEEGALAQLESWEKSNTLLLPAPEEHLQLATAAADRAPAYSVLFPTKKTS